MRRISLSRVARRNCSRVKPSAWSSWVAATPPRFRIDARSLLIGTASVAVRTPEASNRQSGHYSRAPDMCRTGCLTGARRIQIKEHSAQIKERSRLHGLPSLVSSQEPHPLLDLSGIVLDLGGRRGQGPGGARMLGYGATRPPAWKAAWVSGMSSAQNDSICSATISISRCGNEGKCESACLVRSERKFMSERAFIVTYIDE